MNGPTIVFQSAHVSDAQLACARLQAADIGAEVRDEDTAINFGGAILGEQGVTVIVPEEQAEAARELLALPPVE
ncbi:MAG: DUF2007 domain-containing protein [Pedosphaera sp.]|nr:DUF2007 domain-containing protein [Pedosphaera sp.]